MLSPHLCRSRSFYVNTLMIQKVLAETAWKFRLNARDLRRLTPCACLYPATTEWKTTDHAISPSTSSCAFNAEDELDGAQRLNSTAR